MGQDTGSEESEKLPTLPLQGEALVAQTIDSILESEAPLPLIEKMLNQPT